MTLDIRSALQWLAAIINTLLALPGWIFDSLFVWTRFVAIGLCVCIAAGTGCAVVDTGPKVVQTAVSGTTAVGKTLLAAYAPKSMHANAEAKVNDPRYRVQTFVGSGVYVDMLISLEGAEVGFEIDTAGEGKDLSQELKMELVRTWADPNMTEAERQKRIEALALQYIMGAPKEAVEPEKKEPEPDTPAVE